MELQTYLQQHYSPDTAKSYKREIEIYISNYPRLTGGQAGADKAVYKDITNYIGALRQRYSKPATINRILSSIKVYYDYLCNAGVRNDNPAKSIKLRDKRTRDIQLQDLFTAEELEQLLNRKERYTHLDYRNKVLCSLLIYQALYPSELEAIEATDINLQEGNIYIKATSKTNARTLHLKPGQILLFKTYIDEIRPQLLGFKAPPSEGLGEAALLIGIRGGAMTAEDITKHVKRSFKNVYPGRALNAQTIRQSVITNLLKQGNDISVVQVFAGHKYPSTTQRYKQSEVETLKAAIQKYHPMR